MDDDTKTANVRYQDGFGGVYEARKLLGENYGTVKDGHRVKSHALPVRESLAEAQTDLDIWAKTRGYAAIAPLSPEVS